MAPLIREARPEDAAAIARVHVDTWRSTYRGLIPDAVLDGLSYPERENAWVGILRNRDKFTYVAEADGAVVGFANGGAERSRDPEYRGEIYAIYLLESHQGGGLGRSLMCTLATRLRNEGFAALLVWVLADNRARRFYESLGGVLVRTKKRRIGGATLDEVGYGWKDLAPLAAESP